LSVLTSHVESKFFLAAEHQAAALSALQRSLLRLKDGGVTIAEYVLDYDAVASATDIVVAFEGMGFDSERDDEGNLTSLVWVADELPYGPDELVIVLEPFARYVRAASFLRLEEQEDIFTLTFDGPRVRRTAEDDSVEDDEAGALADSVRRALADQRNEDAFDLLALQIAHPSTSEERRQLAWERRGELLRREKLWSELEALYIAAPRDMLSFSSLVDELESSEPDVALAFAQLGVEHEPGAGACHALITNRASCARDYDSVVSAARRWRATCPSDDGAARWEEAWALLALEHYEEVLACALDSNSNWRERRADALLALGRDTEASAELEQALTFASADATAYPDWAPALAAVARIQARLGRHEDALASAKAARTRSDGLEAASPALAAAYLEAGDAAEAVQLIASYAAARPTQEIPTFLWAKALASRDPARAAQILTQATRNNSWLERLATRDPVLAALAR